MAKRSKRRRNSHSKHAEQQQHLQVAKNGEGESSSSAPQPERTVEVLQEAAAKANPFEPMERFMQAFMPFAWFRPWAPLPPAPKLDVIDRSNTVLVRAEVPGVRKNRLEVEASDVSVTIKGEVEHDETREDERYRISETSRGAFERTVHLPSEVDSTKARATFKDGVVEVTLPKLDRSRPHQLKL
jgi:HSP20 family protein